MNKEILRLAIPNILSNISVPLLSSFDTALMGRLTEMHIGAVGLGAMIFNFIYWNFGFLRMGTTGITAQAFGRKDESEIANTMGRAVLVVLIVSALLIILKSPILDLSIILMNVQLEQVDIVRSYFNIRIWAAPATLAFYAFAGWFFGMQNAIFPLILTIVVNVVNMAFSYYFVMVLGWEADGVAMGTLIAQYAGLILGVILFSVKYGKYYRLMHRDMILRWHKIKDFLTVNLDIFIRTILLTLSFVIFYRESASEGSQILAVNVILLNFVHWMSYGVDGFAFAAESLTGKYKGADNQPTLLKAIKYSFIWGMVFAVMYSLLFYFGGKGLLRIFTTDTALIQAGVAYLLILAIFPILSSPCYIWDGIFVGLTASKSMRNAMFISFVIYLALVYGLKPLYGNYGLWMALMLFMLVRGLVQWGFFKKWGTKLR